MKRTRIASLAIRYIVTVFSVLITAVMTQAQNAQTEFYRLTAEAGTVITEFTPEGSLSWSNSALAGTNTVECADVLAETVEWFHLASIPATATVQTVWVWNTHPMMAVPAGELIMGNSVTNDETYYELPVHTVSVSAFSMDRDEVSLELWNIVAAWARRHGYDIADMAAAKGGAHPVVNVSWYDCVKWCNARSERQGLTPCYRSPSDTNIVYRYQEIFYDENGEPVELDLTADCVLWNANGYRLPTEAEWEYAARGGMAGARFPGPSSNEISHAAANYFSYWDSGAPVYGYDTNAMEGHHPSYTNGAVPYTSPAGSFPVNGYGLSDMAGNVSEWCWDWFDGDFYINPSASQPDTTGPISGGIKVIRGGSWANDAYTARCSGRNTFNMRGGNNEIGFRTVRRGNSSALQFSQTQSKPASITSFIAKGVSSTGVVVSAVSKTSGSGNGKAGKASLKTHRSKVRSTRR
jgi:formylglycine-generating enzyme required for sulfatase activity